MMIYNRIINTQRGIAETISMMQSGKIELQNFFTSTSLEGTIDNLTLLYDCFESMRANACFLYCKMEILGNSTHALTRI